MKFFVENVPVYFPYPFVYEEQYAYMRHLKRAIDRKGKNHESICCNLLHPHLGSHCMLEMPTGTLHIPDYITAFRFYDCFRALMTDISGTGKTVTLLSFVTSYQQYCAEKGDPVPKLVYCTRTVQEMEKVLKELKEVTKYRLSECGKTTCDILAIGLSSRRNLCVHETISRGDRNAVDAGKRLFLPSQSFGTITLCIYAWRHAVLSLSWCHRIMGP